MGGRYARHSDPAVTFVFCENSVRVLQKPADSQFTALVLRVALADVQAIKSFSAELSEECRWYNE